MEHKIKIGTNGEKDITIMTQDIVDRVLSCEAGGFDYWASIGYDQEEYKAARARLAGKVCQCYEDILVEILEHGGTDGSGGKLKVLDIEDGKQYMLTLEKLLTGWGAYIAYAEQIGRDGTDFYEYDADSADGILQYAIFGDWIYG